MIYRICYEGKRKFALPVKNREELMALRNAPENLNNLAKAKQGDSKGKSELLQLAYNLWQADRQGKNVEEIVRRAGALYDKVVGFQDSFEDIGNYIGRLTKSFEDAKKKLYEGNANIMRQTESLKELGVTPKKQLKLEE
jgi:hypothetical protein